jgi:hypothetical protein
MPDLFLANIDDDIELDIYSLSLAKRKQEIEFYHVEEEDFQAYLPFVDMMGSGLFIGRHGYTGMGDFYSNTHGNTGMGFF